MQNKIYTMSMYISLMILIPHLNHKNVPEMTMSTKNISISESAPPAHDVLPVLHTPGSILYS
jgi:hypothetical protein